MRNQNNNINSLLDTLANVIGILIIVFAVTQIIVTDAASKIKHFGYSLQELNQNTLKEKRREKDRLQKQLGDMGHSDPNRSQRQELYAKISDMREKYRDSEYAKDEKTEIQHYEKSEDKLSTMANLISELKESYNGSEFSKLAPDKLQELNEELNKEVQKLYENVKEFQQNKIRIEDLLNNNKNLSFNVDNSVMLPDPKPAPESATFVLWTCRYGKIMEVPVESLLRVLYDELPKGVGSSNSTVQRIVNVINYFDEKRVGVSEFYWELIPVINDNGSLASLYACLKWDKEAGENKDELSLDFSTYKTRIDYINQSKQEHCFQFHVWEDSFDVYLMSRQIASQNDIAAGWIVYHEDELFIGMRLWPETKSESDSGTTDIMID